MIGNDKRARAKNVYYKKLQSLGLESIEKSYNLDHLGHNYWSYNFSDNEMAVLSRSLNNIFFVKLQRSH